MRFSDIDRNPTRNKLRGFAVACLVVFSCLGGFRLWNDSRSAFGLALLVAGLLIGSLGLARPSLLRPLMVGASIVTFPMGWLVSHAALAIVFYGLILPAGLAFRLLRRDPLRVRRMGVESYWIARTGTADPEQYFREF